MLETLLGSEATFTNKAEAEKLLRRLKRQLPTAVDTAASNRAPVQPQHRRG
jgi:hypothetical protein